MSAVGQLALFAVLLVAEAAALYQGQRRLFWMTVEATGSRALAYALAAPGTILHESSHYLAALVLGVPAGDQTVGRDGKRGRVSFFRPRRQEDGSVVLGSVPIAKADPLRGAVIAIAPLLLVPALLLGLTYLLLGTVSSGGMLSAFTHAALWKELLWLYLAFSCGQAAFPSPGDHIGALGALALALAAGALIFVLYSHGGISQLAHVTKSLAAVTAPPAASVAVSLLVFQALGRVRAHRKPGTD